jgi:ABC-type transport system involved in multi-copper enzyme maturation permease subunit
MRAWWVIARHTMQECRRRKVFLVVPIATVGFVALFALGAHFAFRAIDATPVQTIDTVELAGATLVGLAMFVTLFFSSALGIFLTFSAARGDAEQGLLQPLVVRPVARSGLLIGRFIGAVVLCVSYALSLYACSVLIIGVIGDWWPHPAVLPAIYLAAAVTVVIALTLLASIYLSALTTGIAMFMVYGAGLMAGLLNQLGNALHLSSLESTGKIASWLIPFEALYQAGLNSLTASATGFTRVVVQLGPLGGAEPGGPWLAAWTILYLVLVGAGTLAAFARRDL